MSKPLLSMKGLPEFTAIRATDVVPAVTAIIEHNKKEISRILNSNEPSWDQVIDPIEQLNTRLSEVWSPVGHLNSVLNSDALRDAYNACLPLLSEYNTELGQNEQLFAIVKQIKESSSYSEMSFAQQKVIDNQLRDFHLSGVDLEPAKKQRYGEIVKRLSELSSVFSENVLDATQAWSKIIIDQSELAGLPASALQSVKSAAKQKGQEGYRLTLDFPSYIAVITYADRRALREEVYRAFATRASDQSNDSEEAHQRWDNTQIMREIITLRTELATLLGFASYAQYSLATKMAKTPEQVIQFLNDLALKSKSQATAEFAELRQYALNLDALDDLQAWDIAYYSEKLKQEKYSVSQELLRPYFPAPKVVNGMFEVVGKLFDIRCRANNNINVWHPDVRYFDLCNANDEVIAGFYLDLYARDKKRGGAWMGTCKVKHQTSDGQVQIPVAYLTCNFTPPVEDSPALLTHNEVTTLFHEFGHGLHHMLTQIEYAAVSGINGVAWDAVELPSQFMENWCWQKEAIDLISGHHETGKPLPEDLLDKMLAAKNFQSGMQMVRQLEFSLFDMHLHLDAVKLKQGDTFDIQAVLDRVRRQVAVVNTPSFNRFQHSFTHVFGGGYAAGYYSYKWAEVLSADAFSVFEEKGIFDKSSGQRFQQNILELGGSREPMELFKAFMGREPSVDALLRHSGIAA